ncbi:MAG: TetR family transcriptional regulator [Acidobacteria bacterium]|nr:TetR family transcriptional regulator [Acidobacteriota bacterium]
MELFVERGYDDVTVADIVERAGLGRRSFYNHFADKREVLFAAADDFQTAVLGALADANLAPTALDAVIEAFAQAAERAIAGHRELAHARQRLIDSSPELRERDLVKTAALNAAVADSLTARGVATREANYVAQAAAMAFAVGVDNWVVHPDLGLTTSIRSAVQSLRAALDADQGSASIG